MTQDNTTFTRLHAPIKKKLGKTIYWQYVLYWIGTMMERVVDIDTYK